MKYKISGSLAVIVIVCSVLIGECYKGIACQLYKNGLYIDPVIGNTRIVMKEGWVPLLKSELEEVGTNIVDIRFEKIKGCNSVDSLNAQATDFSRKEILNIRGSSRYTEYPWGGAEVLNTKTSDGQYMFFLEKFRLALFTYDLSNLDEIKAIRTTRN